MDSRSRFTLPFYRRFAPESISRQGELTRAILVESCRLPGGFAGDPADGIIVATARSLGAALVTKDRRIRDYDHVRTVW